MRIRSFSIVLLFVTACHHGLSFELRRITEPAKRQAESSNTPAEGEFATRFSSLHDYADTNTLATHPSSSSSSDESRQSRHSSPRRLSFEGPVPSFDMEAFGFDAGWYDGASEEDRDVVIREMHRRWRFPDSTLGLWQAAIQARRMLEFDDAAFILEEARSTSREGQRRIRTIALGTYPSLTTEEEQKAELIRIHLSQLRRHLAADYIEQLISAAFKFEGMENMPAEAVVQHILYKLDYPSHFEEDQIEIYRGASYINAFVINRHSSAPSPPESPQSEGSIDSQDVRYYADPVNSSSEEDFDPASRDIEHLEYRGPVPSFDPAYFGADAGWFDDACDEDRDIVIRELQNKWVFDHSSLGLWHAAFEVRRTITPDDADLILSRARTSAANLAPQIRLLVANKWPRYTEAQEAKASLVYTPLHHLRSDIYGYEAHKLIEDAIKYEGMGGDNVSVDEVVQHIIYKVDHRQDFEDQQIAWYRGM